jgi:hypothetical protein
MMCGISSSIATIDNRRCQIAARSIPSNHASTTGNTETRTMAADINRTASAPASWPRNEPQLLPAGPAAHHSTAKRPLTAAMLAGPACRTGGSQDGTDGTAGRGSVTVG